MTIPSQTSKKQGYKHENSRKNGDIVMEGDTAKIDYNMCFYISLVVNKMETISGKIKTNENQLSTKMITDTKFTQSIDDLSNRQTIRHVQQFFVIKTPRTSL